MTSSASSKSCMSGSARGDRSRSRAERQAAGSCRASTESPNMRIHQNGQQRQAVRSIANDQDQPVLGALRAAFTQLGLRPPSALWLVSEGTMPLCGSLSAEGHGLTRDRLPRAAPAGGGAAQRGGRRMIMLIVITVLGLFGRLVRQLLAARPRRSACKVLRPCEIEVAARANSAWNVLWNRRLQALCAFREFRALRWTVRAG